MATLTKAVPAKVH